MPVFVNSLQKKMKADPKLLKVLSSVVETALKMEGRNDDPEVSIVLVEDEYIRELNLQYRHKDQPTDVLSFSMEEASEDEPSLEWDEGSMLGDIIVSVETAARQAEEYGHSELREMAYLVTHGMFHLMGYDHENDDERRNMRDKEEHVLAILDIPR